MFTINCFKNNGDIKYAALGNNELLQKVRNVDTTKLFLVGINSLYKGGIYKKKKHKKIKSFRKSV